MPTQIAKPRKTFSGKTLALQAFYQKMSAGLQLGFGIRTMAQVL